MKKRTFDMVVLMVIAIFLLGLSYASLLEASAKFMVVPFFAAYFIGQFSERHFKE